MTISRKLIVSYALMVLFAAVMGVVGITSLSTVNDEVQAVTGNALPSVEYSLLMRADILDFRNRETQLLLAKNAEEIADTLKRQQQNADDLATHEVAYAKLVNSSQEQTLFGDYQAAKTRYLKANQALRELVSAGKNDEAIAYFRGDDRKAFRAFLPTIDKIVEINRQEAASGSQAAHAAFSSGRLHMLLWSGLILLASIGLACWLIPAIVLPLSRMQQTIVEIGSRLDFTRRVDVRSSDEIGLTVSAFNQLVDSVQQALRGIIGASSELSALSGSLASSSGRVSDDSARQSEASSAMAAAVEQLTTSIAQVSDSAGEALRFSEQADQHAQHGGRVIRDAVAEMETIAATIHQLAETIAHLGSQSDEISSIVRVIREVAEQTNLLALNAAIEAARAGEQGRGFAVVADEVRKLAERTSSATQDIAGKINAIQDASRAAVNGMSGAVDRVNQGVNLAGEAGRSVDAITAGARQVEAEIHTIADALKEQSEASHLLAGNVERISQMSEENSQIAGQTSQLARSLQQLADDMRGTVGRFAT
ncbi:methyl-accepting chemotaxis protein [Andreprevotia lacus DSM 23236]|uniref:Methyl-accepting chemotaxis protein n=1 Tax=Andreprevotia lacus DSM 23236 TaxID=1121001 RepID=A0A1W1X023_9NEIS|nr:methyl-accepting chemotaxis protein [Andreprevotia lacus]SMC16741.1 methyl-accepting chemotaxis protein [Andreprevotia lacus DSM 23236]